MVNINMLKLTRVVFPLDEGSLGLLTFAVTHESYLALVASSRCVTLVDNTNTVR